MRGISPIIATVLLLLMAIGAMGGAWVWYQRMASTAQKGGEADIGKMKQSFYTSLVGINSVYVSGSDLKIEIANHADVNVTVNKIEYRSSPSGSFSTCTSSPVILNKEDITTVTCSGAGSSFSSGDTVYIKFYFKGGATREMPVVIE